MALKRSDFSKLSKEEFVFLLNKAKRSGLSHDEAFEKVQHLCEQIEKPSFRSADSKPRNKNEFIEMFYSDIANR